MLFTSNSLILGLLLVLKCLSWTPGSLAADNTLKIEQAKEYLRKNVYPILTNITAAMSYASFNFQINMTDETLKKKNALDVEFQDYQIKLLDQIRNNIDWKNINDPELTRQIKLILINNPISGLDRETGKRFLNVNAEMVRIFNGARVKTSDGTLLSLSPELNKIMTSSTNSSLLKWTWRAWRNVTGPPILSKYVEFLKLVKESVVGINKLGIDRPYEDYGDSLRMAYYDDETLEDQADTLMAEVTEFYQLLHTYARRVLRKRYPERTFPESGQIPADLLGNMMATVWNEAIPDPFPEKPSLDVTQELLRQNYTGLKMAKMAESFFLSLGFDKLPEEFFTKSIFEKPKDNRIMSCQASAFDLSYDDKRIKTCKPIGSAGLTSMHHEMGHIMYFLQYRDQPPPYRSSPSPPYHEALGNMVALSVYTPTHLKNVGLLPIVDNSKEFTINLLLNQALQKIPLLAFSYILDKWRWEVYRGKLSSSEYNEYWWKLRCKYQGVSPPIKRSKGDFDPAAKNHVVASVPYIRYFFSTILQFQMHEALCNLSNYDVDNKPLHLCSIYKSKEAGESLRNMMKLGSSIKGHEALTLLTGSSVMSSKAQLKYFQPLKEWLIEQLKGEKLGWSDDCSSAIRNIPQFSSLFITILFVLTEVLILNLFNYSFI